MLDDLINGSTATNATIDRDLRDESTSPQILVHLSKTEAEYLDIMQGGMRTIEIVPGDPSTAVRSYEPLDNLLEIPEIKAGLDEIFSKFMHANTMHNLEDDIKKNVPLPSPYEYTEGDFSPEGAALEAAGTLKYKNDMIIAYMPINFANYLTHFMGVDERDPIYDLRQYGFFDKIIGTVTKFVSRITGIKQTHLNEAIRIGSTIVGGMIGGPAGAGAGAAIGNLATGADPMKSLKRGVGVAGVTSAAGSALNLAAPSVLQTYPALATSLGQGPGGFLGSWGSADKVATLANNTPSKEMGDQFLNVADKAKNLDKTVESSGWLDKLTSNPLVPIGALGTLAYFGKKEEDQREREMAEENDAAHNALLEEQRERMGYYSPFKPGKPKPRSLNYVTPNQMTNRNLFNKGGAVYLEPGEEYVTGFKYLDGNTKGQDDEVPINLPKGAWVVDASTTSMLGDGNSKAGKTVIEKFSNYLESKAKHIPNLKVPEGRVPCLLSDGEPSLPPETMSVLGYISNPNKKDHNAEGALVMKKITNNIRKHKTMNKGGLPPRAKDILDYAPINIRKRLNA